MIYILCACYSYQLIVGCHFVQVVEPPQLLKVLHSTLYHKYHIVSIVFMLMILFRFCRSLFHLLFSLFLHVQLSSTFFSFIFLFFFLCFFFYFCYFVWLFRLSNCQIVCLFVLFSCSDKQLYGNFGVMLDINKSGQIGCFMQISIVYVFLSEG